MVSFPRILPMRTFCSHPEHKTGCPDKVVCRCLGVTEAEIVTALTTLPISTLKELRACTGAGDGCTACHKQLRAYLEPYAPAEAETKRIPLPVAALV